MVREEPPSDRTRRRSRQIALLDARHRPDGRDPADLPPVEEDDRSDRRSS